MKFQPLAESKLKMVFFVSLSSQSGNPGWLEDSRQSKSKAELIGAVNKTNCSTDRHKKST